MHSQQQDDPLSHSLSKVPRLSYNKLRQFLRERGNFNYQHDDDLKSLTQGQVMELLGWFFREAFEVDDSMMMANYDPNYFTVVPYFEKFETTLRITNLNLLFYKGLAKINGNLAYEFEMVLKPERYP